MKIVVTGGAGFIGSHLVDSLLAEGHKVFVIDDLSGGKDANLADYHALYHEDCRDFSAMDDIFSEIKPKVVYHLAAQAAENKAQFSPVDSTSRNYDGFVKVMTAGLRHGMKRMIVTSSIAAYGHIETPFKEIDQCRPVDLYGLAKYSMEETLKIMSRVHGFEHVITRPHNVYGPRQSMTDPYRNVVALWMNALLKDEPYVIYGRGGQRRCYTYVDDVVEALTKCATSKKVTNQIINIGADQAYKLSELSQILQYVTKSQCPPRYLPDRPQEVKEAIEDHSKAKKLLGYTTSVTLQEGLAKTWEYAKANGPRKFKYTEIEVDSPKMPANWRV